MARSDGTPYGWSWRRLDAVGTVVTGSTPPTAIRSYYGHSRMFASPADLGEFKYVTRTSKNLSETGYARSRRIPAGSTLFVCIGSTIGKVGLAKEDMTANQQINAVIPGPTVDCEYLYYASTTLSAKVHSLAGEQAVPLMNKSAFSEFEIPFPPMPEQRAIASALADADELIATLERLIGKKQAIKQGMMQQLLTGKIRLPGFTEPWRSGKFEDLAVPVRERTTPKAVAAETLLVELECIESSSGRLVGRPAASSAVSLKTVFRRGDVLFGKLRAYLRKFWLADSDGICSTEIWAFRARPESVSGFVRYVVETDQFIEAATGAYGTHMPRSDWGVVRNSDIEIPQRDEQAAIAAVLLDVDGEIDRLRMRFAKARAIKKGMMQQLLTGRTRLPVKEPAA